MDSSFEHEGNTYLVKNGRITSYTDPKRPFVLIAVSAGFGAGWSTWSNEIDPFDVDVMKAIITEGEEQVLAIAKKKWPDAYLGGIDGLYAHPVRVGTAFRIHEYDGSESVEEAEDIDWRVA